MRSRRCTAPPTAARCSRASSRPCRELESFVNKPPRGNPMGAEPAITPNIIAEHGLTAEEHERILKITGRAPNLTELGIFSVMWSEHCAYKSSRKWLRRLPTTGPVVIQGPGENAGVVDIGDGQAAVFKIESHNHPSFIEPYQGA